MRAQLFSTPCLLLMFFSNLVLNLNTLVSGQCLKDQQNILLQLKQNLTYDSSISTKLVQWNKSTDCCQWNGVKCDSKARVSGIDLSSEAITDGIDTLFQLQFLQSLNLAHNNLGSVQSTDLPSGFGKLKELSYLNLSNSGFSGQIPAEFSGLTRLVVLDLSSPAYLPLNLENPNLKALIQNFTRLRQLYLDGSNISANGLIWGEAISSSLPDLRILSLRNTYITGPIDSSLAKLKSISIIRLDENTFSSKFPNFFADFSNLSVLTLSSCDLSGFVPSKLFRIPSLKTVDLSNNRDLQGTLPEFPLNGSIENLVLTYTQFSGQLTDSIANLRMLSSLSLGSCNFSGPIPKSITNLVRLVDLDLSINHFTGSVPSFSLSKNLSSISLRRNGLSGEIHDSLFEGLENLGSIDFTENLLQGEIPGSLFFLPSLKLLYLSNNRFNGPIQESKKISSSLEVLDLGANQLNGIIPRFFFELRNVSSLSVHSNKFNGSINLADFRKLTNLVNLDLSYNDLSVDINENVSIVSLFPLLGSLMLASCKLKKVPFLKDQTSLKMLDLSDNELNGQIPNWIWDLGDGLLPFLNLSHNHFTSLQEPYKLRAIQMLDLHSNFLTGKIPVPPPSSFIVDFSSNNFSSFIPPEIGNSLRSALYFSIANNKVVGTIPSSFCNATRLEVLDLSNNSLSGTIPSCLVQNEFGVLNLKRNNLTGDIPDVFLSTCNLETLDLSWNMLQNQVPKSLENCTKLEVLNLGNNELNGTFPCWLKKLPKLRVLVLRHNKFHGDIHCLDENLDWTSLQIIDFASNNLDGVLPENLFSSLKAMMVDEKQTIDHLNFFLSQSQVYYQDSVTVTLKGKELELEKILTVFTSIDFSENHFQGEVPVRIGELKSLKGLNFSHNSLSGRIPASIGNLQPLEALDLSFNNLEGQIPNELASLTYLSFLNLSNNRLSGRIPPGSQIQTFPESSFRGNERLCGFPLNINCTNVRSAPQVPTSKEDQEQEGSNVELYSGAALGFIVGLGVVFGPILYSRRYRKYYNKRINRLILFILHRQDQYRLETE